MIGDGGRRVLDFAEDLGVTVERLLDLLKTHDLHIISDTALREEKAHAVKVTADAMRAAQTGRRLWAPRAGLWSRDECLPDCRVH